jgi:Lipopolysaccharide kinase (Kdo/WaaP) family
MAVRFEHEQDWTDLVGHSWYDHLMSAGLFDRLHSKQGRSIARWTIRRDARQLTVFVKRHYRHAVWRSWLACLWPLGGWSDAGREWQQLQIARRLGLAVPRALAMAEWTGAELKSALVVEELSGMIALHEAISLAARSMSPERFRRWKRGLIAEMVRMVRLLHDRNYFHRDLYLCHFFVASEDLKRTPSNWSGRVVLIDFHRLSRRRVLSFLARVKDLAQLLYSARVEGVSPRDALQFWRSYGGSRWLGWAVGLKARLYSRHHLQSDPK